MPENQSPIESIESDSRAQDLLFRIDSFLARDEDVLRNLETEKVAEFLRGVLETFGKLDTAGRRKVFPAMQKLVMHKFAGVVNDDETLRLEIDFIDSEVITKLSNPDKSIDLKSKANELKSKKYLDNAGKIHQLFRGTYDVCQLSPAGEVLAYAYNREEGGSAHEFMLGKNGEPTLAQFALMKALMGLHLQKQNEEFGENKSIVASDMIAEFENGCGLAKGYYGNYGPIGVSGAEMTEEEIHLRSDSLTEAKKAYWDFFLAGDADNFFAKLLSDEGLGENIMIPDKLQPNH